MKSFIYRKMALLWCHIFPVLTVTFLGMGLTGKPLVVHLKSWVEIDLKMMHFWYGITLYKNFISSLTA